MQYTCLNCGTIYDGSFCSNCSQKSSTHRITFQTILHDIPHSVMHIDKGFFFTFWQLLYRPGYVVRNYLAGKRVNYFSPLAYLFLLSAVSSFVSHFAVEYRAMRFDFTYMMFPGVAVFFNHYPALMFCLLTPFLAFWTWLFNRDLKYNYWENFIFNTYLIAQFNVILILFDMARIMQWYTSPKLTPMIILFIGYMVFTSRQFFKHKFSVVRISLNTAMYLCNAFTFMTGLVFAGFMTPWWPDSF